MHTMTTTTTTRTTRTTMTTRTICKLTTMLAVVHAISCPAGEGITPTQVGPNCTACPSGQYSVTNDTFCKACAAGFFQAQSAQSACTACAVGQAQPNNSSSSCSACAAGRYSNATGLTDCLDCFEGQFQAQTGQPACVACVPGQAHNSPGSASCTACGTGQSSNGLSGANTCTSCVAGRFQDTVGQPTCKDCAEGQYNPLSNQTQCVACRVGHYQDQKAQLDCLECAAGFFQADSGRKNCDSCAAGEVQPLNGSTSCNACNAGQFQDTVAQRECKKCAAGQFQNGAAQIDCTLCRGGQFTSIEGKTACDGAPSEPGTFAPHGQTFRVEPRGCPRSTVAPQTGMAACVECAAEEFTPGVNSTECSPCQTQGEPSWSDNIRDANGDCSPCPQKCSPPSKCVAGIPRTMFAFVSETLSNNTHCECPFGYYTKLDEVAGNSQGFCNQQINWATQEVAIYWFAIGVFSLVMMLLGLHPCWCCGYLLLQHERKPISKSAPGHRRPKSRSDRGKNASKGDLALFNTSFGSSSWLTRVTASDWIQRARSRGITLWTRISASYEQLDSWQRYLFMSWHVLCVISVMADERNVFAPVVFALLVIGYAMLYRRGRNYPARGAESITFYTQDLVQTMVVRLKGYSTTVVRFTELDRTTFARIVALISDILLQGQANRAIEVLRAMFLGALTFLGELFWLFSIWFRLVFSCFLILKGRVHFDPDLPNLSLFIAELLATFREFVTFMGELGRPIARLMQEVVQWAQDLSFGFTFEVAVPSDCPGNKLLISLCSNLVLLVLIIALIQSESLRRFKIMAINSYERTTTMVSHVFTTVLFYLLQVMVSSLQISAFTRDFFRLYNDMPNAVECRSKIPVDEVVFYLLKVFLLALGAPLTVLMFRIFNKSGIDPSAVKKEVALILLGPPGQLALLLGWIALLSFWLRSDGRSLSYFFWIVTLQVCALVYGLYTLGASNAPDPGAISGSSERFKDGEVQALITADNHDGSVDLTFDEGYVERQVPVTDIVEEYRPANARVLLRPCLACGEACDSCDTDSNRIAELENANTNGTSIWCQYTRCAPANWLGFLKLGLAARLGVIALHLAFVFGHMVVLFLQGKLSGVTLREGVAHSRYQSRDAFANVTQQLCSRRVAGVNATPTCGVQFNTTFCTGNVGNASGTYFDELKEASQQNNLAAYAAYFLCIGAVVAFVHVIMFLRGGGRKHPGRWYEAKVNHVHRSGRLTVTYVLDGEKVDNMCFCSKVKFSNDDMDQCERDGYRSSLCSILRRMTLKQMFAFVAIHVTFVCVVALIYWVSQLAGSASNGCRKAQLSHTTTQLLFTVFSWAAAVFTCHWLVWNRSRQPQPHDKSFFHPSSSAWNGFCRMRPLSRLLLGSVLAMATVMVPLVRLSLGDGYAIPYSGDDDSGDDSSILSLGCHNVGSIWRGSKSSVPTFVCTGCSQVALEASLPNALAMCVCVHLLLREQDSDACRRESHSTIKLDTSLAKSKLLVTVNMRKRIWLRAVDNGIRKMHSSTQRFLGLLLVLSTFGLALPVFGIPIARVEPRNQCLEGSRATHTEIFDWLGAIGSGALAVFMYHRFARSKGASWTASWNTFVGSYKIRFGLNLLQSFKCDNDLPKPAPYIMLAGLIDSDGDGELDCDEWWAAIKSVVLSPLRVLQNLVTLPFMLVFNLPTHMSGVRLVQRALTEDKFWDSFIRGLRAGSAAMWFATYMAHITLFVPILIAINGVTGQSDAPSTPNSASSTSGSPISVGNAQAGDELTNIPGLPLQTTLVQAMSSRLPLAVAVTLALAWFLWLVALHERLQNVAVHSKLQAAYNEQDRLFEVAGDELHTFTLGGPGVSTWNSMGVAFTFKGGDALITVAAGKQAHQEGLKTGDALVYVAGRRVHPGVTHEALNAWLAAELPGSFDIGVLDAKRYQVDRLSFGLGKVNDTIAIGQRVRCRDGNGQWQKGVVESKDQHGRAKVLIDESSESYYFDEVQADSHNDNQNKITMNPVAQGWYTEGTFHKDDNIEAQYRFIEGEGEGLSEQEWSEAFFPAKILQCNGGMYKVQYDTRCIIEDATEASAAPKHKSCQLVPKDAIRRRKPRNGKAKVRYADNTIYDGEWKDGKRHGNGFIMNVLQPGDPVNARFQGSTSYYPGTIKQRQGTGGPGTTYDVEFVDGERDAAVEATSIVEGCCEAVWQDDTRLPLEDDDYTGTEGLRVQCRDAGDWHLGTVDSVNENGRPKVRLEGESSCFFWQEVRPVASTDEGSAGVEEQVNLLKRQEELKRRAKSVPNVIATLVGATFVFIALSFGHARTGNAVADTLCVFDTSPPYACEAGWNVGEDQRAAGHDHVSFDNVELRFRPSSSLLEASIGGGEFGLVCLSGTAAQRDRFADIACKMMDAGSASSLSFASSVHSSADFAIRNAVCTSSELVNNRPTGCEYTTIGACESRAVSLSCTRPVGDSLSNIAFRLTQGGTRSGLLESRRASGQWGAVCDDSFSSHSADIACTKMGAGKAISFKAGVPTAASNFTLDDFWCSSPSFGSCSWSASQHDCRQDEGVELQCESDIGTAIGNSNAKSNPILSIALTREMSAQAKSASFLVLLAFCTCAAVAARYALWIRVRCTCADKAEVQTPSTRGWGGVMLVVGVLVFMAIGEISDIKQKITSRVCAPGTTCVRYDDGYALLLGALFMSLSCALLAIFGSRLAGSVDGVKKMDTGSQFFIVFYMLAPLAIAVFFSLAPRLYIGHAEPSLGVYTYPTICAAFWVLSVLPMLVWAREKGRDTQKYARDWKKGYSMVTFAQKYAFLSATPQKRFGHELTLRDVDDYLAFGEINALDRQFLQIAVSVKVTNDAFSHIVRQFMYNAKVTLHKTFGYWHHNGVAHTGILKTCCEYFFSDMLLVQAVRERMAQKPKGPKAVARKLSICRPCCSFGSKILDKVLLRQQAAANAVAKKIKALSEPEKRHILVNDPIIEEPVWGTANVELSAGSVAKGDDDGSDTLSIKVKLLARLLAANVQAAQEELERKGEGNSDRASQHADGQHKVSCFTGNLPWRHSSHFKATTVTTTSTADLEERATAGLVHALMHRQSGYEIKDVDLVCDLLRMAIVDSDKDHSGLWQSRYAEYCRKQCPETLEQGDSHGSSWNSDKRLQAFGAYWPDDAGECHVPRDGTIESFNTQRFQEALTRINSMNDRYKQPRVRGDSFSRTSTRSRGTSAVRPAVRSRTRGESVTPKRRSIALQHFTSAQSSHRSGRGARGSVAEFSARVEDSKECQLATDFELLINFMVQLQLEQALLSCSEGRELVEAVLQAEGKNIALFWLLYPPGAVMGKLAEALNEAHLDYILSRSGLALKSHAMFRVVRWWNALFRWCCSMVICFSSVPGGVGPGGGSRRLGAAGDDNQLEANPSAIAAFALYTLACVCDRLHAAHVDGSLQRKWESMVETVRNLCTRTSDAVETADIWLQVAMTKARVDRERKAWAAWAYGADDSWVRRATQDEPEPVKPLRGRCESNNPMFAAPALPPPSRPMFAAPVLPPPSRPPPPGFPAPPREHANAPQGPIRARPQPLQRDSSIAELDAQDDMESSQPVAAPGVCMTCGNPLSQLHRAAFCPACGAQVVEAAPAGTAIASASRGLHKSEQSITFAQETPSSNVLHQAPHHRHAPPSAPRRAEGKQPKHTIPDPQQASV